MLEDIFFNLSAVDFLNIFGLVVLGVLSLIYFAIFFADRSGRAPLPIPDTPDPMETAYLSGGLSQVIRTLIYDLDERGFVLLANDGRIKIANELFKSDQIGELERRLLEKIRTSPKIQEIFDDRALRDDLHRLLTPVRARLGLENLLLSPGVLNVRRVAEILGALTILFFGGVKAKLLLDAGQSNISYLLFLIIASIASVYALGYVLTRNVASRRGRLHIEAMRGHFADRLEATIAQIRSPGPMARAFSGAALYLIGLYGLSILKGTTEAKFAEAFDGVAGDGDE
jgi:uncharacterized protein (TIGR04222 family)